VARRISGLRIGRSFVSPTGVAEVERELDFNLAANTGVELVAVQGYGNLHNDTPPVSDTVPFSSVGHQTLHLETGATEDLPDAAGEDADDLDSEIFWAQFFVQQGVVGSTVTFGASATLTAMPPGITYFDVPILSPRNIIHKGTTIEADVDLECGVLLHYYFIELSNAELGLALARR